MPARVHNALDGCIILSSMQRYNCVIIIVLNLPSDEIFSYLACWRTGLPTDVYASILGIWNWNLMMFAEAAFLIQFELTKCYRESNFCIRKRCYSKIVYYYISHHFLVHYHGVKCPISEEGEMNEVGSIVVSEKTAHL